MYARISNFDSELVAVAADVGVVHTVSTSVVAAPTFADAAERATHVVVSVRDAPVFVTIDGSDPDAAGHGRSYPVGVPFVMARQAFRKSRWLRDGGTDALVYCEPVVSQN
tara:strand:+ start:219 stop:548 length:330 start_codon:yes stop_codon:yes gene_type:complete